MHAGTEDNYHSTSVGTKPATIADALGRLTPSVHFKNSFRLKKSDKSGHAMSGTKLSSRDLEEERRSGLASFK